MAGSLADAVRALAAGELVVVPTDTLLGLAASARDRRALDRLQRAKGRPTGMPISIAVSSTEELERFARLSRVGRAFARRHLPGPFTVLAAPSVTARRTLDPSVARGPTIGLRVPDHPLARELCRRAGPITATSANRHGVPTARTVEEARRAFGASVRIYLPARPAPSGVPSTLVDLTGSQPRPVARR